MAWNDASELVVASSGQISVAPVGTALPTTPTAALNAAFVGLGYVSEDGVTITVTPEIQDFNAWQSRQAIRRESLSQEITAAFALEQWNEATVPLAFGGGVVSEPTSGVFRYDFPEAADALDERALVVDWNDGDRDFRLVMPRGNVTESVEAQFTRSALALLPITFSVLEPVGGGNPAYLLTNDDAAFETGS